ncbi:hypothetical protein [uncultured Lacinutrix sp.]|uniref:hypothetical protein n=1 Tax=uncultured Lacinutrix sp. TaxID=574032 RepID=UPI002633D78F|nr:hypothetical protein [uncultured Lacinutrix sp.]
MKFSTPFKYIIALVFFTSVQSCIQGVKEIKSWIEASNIEEVEGSYHNLNEDGIKLYLPSVFKKHSLREYKKIVDSLTSKEVYNVEKKRLNNLRKLDGNFYIFFDEDTHSTFTLNTMPYNPIYRRDAQYLLGVIRKNYENNNTNPDIISSKVTAKYSDKNGPQVFKAVFKIENNKTKDFSYNSTYIMSSNKKTIWIQVSSPYENGVDDYLTKLIM